MGEVRPVYLLAGGRSAPRRGTESLLDEVFRESGKGSPSVGYVGAASGDDEGFFARMAALFRGSGAGQVRHALLAPDDADLAEAKASLAHSDIVCIGGGDVDAGMQLLAERGMTALLTGLYRRGVLFFGISAGSIMLAREWVRWRDPDDDATAEIFSCLGLAPLLCDTHDEEGDWAELKALLRLEKEGTAGYGIAAGTALKVFPDGRIESRGGAVHRYIRQDGDVRRIADVLPQARRRPLGPAAPRA